MLLVSEQGNKLLIDCGSDIRFSLHTAELSHLDITDIYISHIHSDHTGGLEYIGFNTKFDPRCNKPNLYLSKELAGELWNNTLAGGMRSIEGDITNLETFFKLTPLTVMVVLYGQKSCLIWLELFMLTMGILSYPAMAYFLKLTKLKYL